MAVRIRLMRMGAKKKPHYRIVAADARAARDGRFIELLGYYDPRKNPPDVNVDKEKVMKWLKNGAEVTDTVKRLLKKQSLDPDEFRKALKKKK